MSEVIAQIHGRAGLITLNRPKALNALSLPMLRDITAALLAWRHDDRVEVVALRGEGKEGPFGAFCAGGDIRFFHQAALAGDPRLEDFFSEEYALNHLVHVYPKPLAIFMDGIVMGGGMGLAGHGRARRTLRIATERTKMAMPETNIGLFPDVGGGYFLSRCPGHIGEYLALTGHVIGGADAMAAGLADTVLAAQDLPALWQQLGADGAAALAAVPVLTPEPGVLAAQRGDIDRIFGLPTVKAIVDALEADGGLWAHETAQVLRKRSPLMLHVVLEQVRRARAMDLAEELRMERGLVRRCFSLRPGAASETVEGIRALAVDKDHSPRWNPARIEDVKAEDWQAFFEPVWPAAAHPLRDLVG
ncbi:MULTISPECIES: enoyl-CoA hydratase/isomerase family protein [Ramlibacter]|uniref:Enoyl-CoA hydratase/isomerase family protein n=1 Tax=Ramlibacter aquaticus TaxID=2780094 RepID=A0ABR9SFS0_9BURK|nr:MULTISPECIES: enoyl-CoA hydratase/isomerase family protein [Ramlibacter]MBE7941198.1 enoyl-CoA hydratase/isomerase family protein [Ramlibacter aquaticus]